MGMERIAMTNTVRHAVLALMAGAALICAMPASADDLEATYWMMISDRSEPATALAWAAYGPVPEVAST